MTFVHPSGNAHLDHQPSPRLELERVGRTVQHLVPSCPTRLPHQQEHMNPLRRNKFKNHFHIKHHFYTTTEVYIARVNAKHKEVILKYGCYAEVVFKFVAIARLHPKKITYLLIAFAIQNSSDSLIRQ